MPPTAGVAAVISGLERLDIPAGEAPLPVVVK
jgi:hypothetical protein